MRKLRPCVRKLLAGDHPSSLGLRPLAILLTCQGSSPLPWPHLVTAHGGKAGQAVHGTRGAHTRVQEEYQGSHMWLVRHALHKGVHSEVNETQDLAPTLPSQLCALVQGCVCLEKMCLLLILTHAVQGLAGLPGRRTCLQGKDWSKALR